MDIAKARNKFPTPVPKAQFGVRLPNEKHCLLKSNYTVVPRDPASALPPAGPWDMRSTKSATAAAAALHAKQTSKRRRMEQAKQEEPDIANADLIPDTKKREEDPDEESYD
eukprot:m.136555 g.136555  ORF g.136555 m.136555 type:complete len:111 (+) comp52476_c0_seq7:147-479(+)